MKKGILLGLSVVFVTMLSLLVVVGCGSKGIESVTISNKAELTAEWVDYKNRDQSEYGSRC